MEARSRLIIGSVGSVTWLLLVAVAVALVLLVATIYLGAHSNAGSSHAGATAVAPHEQAPDAAERNDIYAQAIAARQGSLTSDAGDRNVELGYRELLSRFNDPSPDAQERNIQLISR